ESKTHRINRAVTAGANRVAAMRSHALAHREVGRHITLIESRHVGGRRRRRRAEDILQHEDSAKDRRRSRRIRRDRQHATLPQETAAMTFRWERHAAESGSIDVGYSIVLRQAFI